MFWWGLGGFRDWGDGSAAPYGMKVRGALYQCRSCYMSALMETISSGFSDRIVPKMINIHPYPSNSIQASEFE